MSDRTPPEAVRAACRRGLSLVPKYGGDGLTEGAKSRARSMAAGHPISPTSARRMAAWFARHDAGYSRQSSPPSPGYVAYLLWGGASGRAWANGIAQQSEKSMNSWKLDDLAMFAKADKRPAWKKKGWVGPGGAWETAKRKAKEQGKPESYARAIYSKMVGKSLPAQDTVMLPYLDQFLEKAGFGSHGGRVIGFTRSSKPIYQSSQLAGASALHARMSAKGRGHETASSHHSQHFSGHSEADHNEAAGAHKEAGAAASARGNHSAARHHENMSNMHADMANHVASGGGAKKPRMGSPRPSMAA